MDKKEALEIFLKVNQECIETTCDDCNFYNPYCGKNTCLFDFLGTEEISKGVEGILYSLEKSKQNKVEYTSTISVPSTLSAEEFEKYLKAILPQNCVLEPLNLPKEDRTIKYPKEIDKIEPPIVSKSRTRNELADKLFKSIHNIDYGNFAKEAQDNVTHPKHYCKGGLECIDAIRAAVSNLPPFEAVCVANIIKYAWRYKDKNGLEDVKKAAKYLQLLQEEMKKNG